MELKKLLNGLETEKVVGDTNIEIEGIAYHSREVRKNFLFAALRGMELDGHKFIEEAIKNGAEAILLEREQEISGRTLILVGNSRKGLAKVSSNFYDDPSSKIKLIGVTGTNGKTTTTYLLESIFKKAGYKVGVIGTINYRYGDKIIQASNTTPESLELQRIIYEMAREGATHVIMEVSSHGLDLDRVYGCNFDGAIFTNFTSDHLDYHKTLTHYFESKRKLFSEYLIRSNKPGRFAVINFDDPMGEEIVKGVDYKVLKYGIKTFCDVTASDISSTFEGLSCRIKVPNEEFQVNTKLIGGFNIYNILASVATGILMGINLKAIKEGIEEVGGVSGRFEKIPNRRGIHVIVDYAHTHDALERALKGLKDILSNYYKNDAKVITVFGCGGDRDRTKRPLMGEVAGRLSDLTIITSDNPRTEDPSLIIQEIEKGLKPLQMDEIKESEIEVWREKKGYLKIPDRREAIRFAIHLAQPNDTVLIAGKGHEDYQIIGKRKFPFDDRLEARLALEAK